MIERIPNNGLQKGQYLSLNFFEAQISKNLSDISTRIRDIIDYQTKRKGGEKKIILSEEQYLSQLYQCYSLNSQYSYGKRQEIPNEQNSLKIIDQKFISDYPLFFQPKWKIWIEGEPNLSQLAMINRLAYGYFYKKSNEGQITCMLKETQKKGLYILQKQIEIEFGVAKIFDKKNSQFVYINFIQYDPNGQNRNQQAEDPRKLFKHKELHVINQQKGIRRKKDETKFMSTAKLKQKYQISLEVYHPFIYKKYKPQSKQIEQYFFRLETFFWYCEKEKYVPPPINTKLNPQVQNFMKGNVMDFSNSVKLVSFLNKIPDFQYDLSEQQKELIQTKGNIIGIGRSGTGKTTCALLRLFSLETLYKISSIGVQEFKSTDIEMPSKMKNVFLTLSPHLVRQLKIYYSKHQTNIKFQIQKKQKKRNSHIEQKQGGGEKNEQKIIINKNFGQNVTCLKNLTQYDFPGFFTIKDFLIMIDGVYPQSYFQRDKNGNLKKFQMDENIYFFEKQIFWTRGPNTKKVNEFKYQDFRDIFWDIEIKHNKQLGENLNPHIVWTQIFSQIKGSIQSHKYPGFQISEEKYVNQSKNRFLTIEQKRRVYMIYKIYSRWNGKFFKFDQMDLVNFLLNKFKTQRYSGPVINHLFIDEVQDLTPATIYLLSQIASNNLFYSGDTAQSITKGVSFKFSDLRLMFRQNSVVKINGQNEPEMKQLTINFRSHNQILRLANSLVKILQLLFPKTIDKLRKQTSDREGPKPIIAKNQKQIKQLLSIGSQQQFKMNAKQVIIVRNSEQKKQAKEIFGNGLIVTIQQSKGLQFDDVVIWKVMQNSRFQKLWKIIDYLQIFQNYHNEKALVNYILEDGCQIDQIDNKLGLSKKFNEISINLYTEICSQLKLLYTAVTRTKDVLIFYHSLPKQLEKLFRRLELVTDYQQQIFMEIGNRKYTKKKKQFNSDKEKQNYYNLHWKKLGKKFYAQENYEQALICFQNINDKNMCIEIEAKIKVKEGEKLMEILNVRQYSHHKDYYYERQLEMKKIKFMFEEAAKMFQQVKLFQEAGKAYYLSQKYKQAIYFFSKMDKFLQIAICYFKLNQFIKAADMYQRSKKYGKVIECLKKSNRLTAALVKLIQYKKQFQYYQKEKELLKKINFKLYKLKYM